MSYALSWGVAFKKNLTALSCAVFIGVNMTKQEIIKRFESFGFKLGLDQ